MRELRLVSMILALLLAVPAANAADFEWVTTGGATKSLADYKGKPVLLHLWASWCPPCRGEMPELEQWSRQHGDVTLIPVTLDANINDAVVFLKSKEIALPALQGNLSQASRLGMRGLPTTIVIGADGGIRELKTGAIHWQDAAVSGEILQALKN